MRRWLREPLLHFLLLGLVIFGAFAVLAPVERAPSSIVVTQDVIDAQVEAFARTWLRAPTPREIDGLIREYVREEVYYREGMALGLDRDDTVIRRRLMQKLEFVAEAESTAVEPTDDQLRAWLETHRDAYRTESRVSFEHVFLSTDRRGDRLVQDAAQLLAELRAGGSTVDPAAFGDPTMLERVFADTPINDLAAQFGDSFATELAPLPLGEWLGPIKSSYGIHLVRVSAREEGRTPELDEVRDAVRRDWLNDQRSTANETYYRSLLQRYAVTIAGRDASVMDGPSGAVVP